MNYKNLLRFIYFGLIIIYIFAVIAYENFLTDYFNTDDGNNPCAMYGEGFLMTVANSLTCGLKNGGGISDSLLAPANPYLITGEDGETSF